METKDFLAAALTVAEKIVDPDEREDAIHWLHGEYKKFQQVHDGEENEPSEEESNG